MASENLYKTLTNEDVSKINSYVGGLEKVLKDKKTVGVLSFIRHGDKENSENKTPDTKLNINEKGYEQAICYRNALGKAYEQSGIKNIEIAAYSSQFNRANQTINTILGTQEGQPNPVQQDERLGFVFEGELKDKYMEKLTGEGETAANDWYINSSFGQEKAEGKLVHALAGTHATLTETLLKRVMINEAGKSGFDSIEDIGGIFGNVGSAHLVYKNTGNYKLLYNEKMYNVDMGQLNDLAN